MNAGLSVARMSRHFLAAQQEQRLAEEGFGVRIRVGRRVVDEVIEVPHGDGFDEVRIADYQNGLDAAEEAEDAARRGKYRIL